MNAHLPQNRKKFLSIFRGHSGTSSIHLQTLSRGPWIYRTSGSEGEEGAFLACTFWLVEAYAELGRREEAKALMDEALRALPSGAGVMSEMVDVKTGDYLGNLPQGLSHLALIHAAMSLDGDRRAGGRRG